MSDSADTVEEPAKTGKFGLVALTGALFAIGLAGGYFVPISGLLSGGAGTQTEAQALNQGKAFVPIDPIIVSLGTAAANRHLSFRAQLEVPSEHASSVASMMPRFVDVLNGYLRAVDVREFEDPLGLIRMRGQMLRRIQMMAGDGMVSDLLVMEFVLN